MRILAVADEPARLDPGAIRRLGVELVVSCGDLPFDYLEYLEDCTDVPLVYVPGNHDPDLRSRPQPVMSSTVPALIEPTPPAGPPGGNNVDVRVVRVAGLAVGGLGGSIRYSGGPNQYSQGEMWGRAARLVVRTLLRRPGRRLDLLLTHAPPLGLGDDDDLAHRGFAAFHRTVAVLSPRYLIHGHIHPYGEGRPDRMLGRTRVVNAVGYRVLELEA